MDCKRTLKVGDKFKPIYDYAPLLTFEVLSIDRENNSLKVRVNGNKVSDTWDENWDDLDVTELAFTMGDYGFC
jgi:hypothetical protein